MYVKAYSKETNQKLRQNKELSNPPSQSLSANGAAIASTCGLLPLI
jgi:hypothetical protein